MTTTPAGSQPPTIPILGEWQSLPAQPGPATNQDDQPKTSTDWITRIILGVVMTAALAVGTWSVYTLLTKQFHAPWYIAAFGCVMFDGAAFFFARLSQRYATTTDSGLAPRAAMLTMICTSSWVNWQHAALEKWGTVGCVILAAAPIVAELSFEMWHRYEHREALRNLGRVAQALPVLGKWAWIAHPFRARHVIDAHIRAGLTEYEAVAERREELAAERARATVSVPVQVHREPEPAQVHEPVTPAVPRTAEPVAALEPVREPHVNHEPEPQEVREPAPAAVNPEPRTVRPAKKNPTANREPANLGDRAAAKRTQIDQVLNLIDELGYDATTLGVVRERTGMTKTTAYHRLTEARTEWQQQRKAS